MRGTANKTTSQSMSDAHHYYLGLYEAEQATEDKDIKEKALAIADAAMDAICDQLDLNGKDWEQMHKQIHDQCSDILWEKGE